MDIVLVGGLTRMETAFVELAERHGHRLAFHSGETKGRRSGELSRLIERTDVVVLVTEVNSHNAVTLAKKECRALGRPYVVVRRCSLSGFERLLASLHGDAQPLQVAS